MVDKIKTAIFPVAGLGTRFLPVTKTGPKEMLPVVDKPIIQYAVQEAIDAGIEHLIFVTSSKKHTIEDYFDRNLQLEMWLQQHGKLQALKTVREIIPSGVNISYVRQPMPLGLGHAILCAKHVVGDQPFAVLLPDDIIASSGVSCMQAMLEQHYTMQASVIAVESVSPSEVDRYGIVALSSDGQGHCINKMVEKPPIGKAPSQLAVIGRYILTPRIFSLLEHIPSGAGGEIHLTDAIVALLKEEKVYAHLLKGVRYDCGDRLGMTKATIAFALQREDLRAEVIQFMRQHLSEVDAELSETVS